MPSRGDTIDKAIELKSDADVLARLRVILPGALEQLENIACGNVPRNAREILKGIETALRFAQPLPKQVVEHQGAIGIAVIDPYATAPGDAAAATISLPAQAPALPAPSPVPPIRRRKAAAPESK